MIATNNNVNNMILISGRDTATPIPRESMAKAIPNKIASFVSIVPEVSKSTFEGSLNIFMAIPKDLILIIAMEVGWAISSLGNLLFNQPWIKNQRPIKNRIIEPMSFIIGLGAILLIRFPAKKPMVNRRIEMKSKIIRECKGTLIFFMP